MRNTLALAALLLIASLTPQSCLNAAEPKWRRLTTANFELLTTEGDRRARAALLHFEQVRSFFLKVGIKEPVSESKTLIVAFQSEKEFKPYRPTESAAAYYQRGYDRDYIVMQELSPDFLSGATHEYVHLLVQHSGMRLPAWLNEGLADFYSTMTPVGKKVKVGEIIPGRIYSFRESKMLDLPTLFTVDHDSPYYNERDRTQIFYAQSWALTHMLMLSETYRPKYGEWMSALVAGKSHEEAFQSAYGQTLATVEKSLNSYFRAATYNYALFDTQLEKSAEEPAIEIVSALESGLALASIMGAGPKADEARELLVGLEKKFPDDHRIPAALGYLALREHPNPDEAMAREQFAKAIAMNSPEVRLLVDYARLLENETRADGEGGLRERGAARDSRSMPVLLRALEMRPTQYEVCYDLARMLFNENAFAQAIIALQPLKSLTREQGRQIFRLLAYLYLQVKQPTDAKSAAERLRGISQTPEEIAEA
ncbi:MAG: hypothetical protein EXQ56_10160 [Acidobacteria bacterium]|nr:hypothetical protein [Acidobacteriota bacterium]